MSTTTVNNAGSDDLGSPTSAAKSSAKEEILARVRRALRDVPKNVAPEVDTPIEWEYGQPTAMPDVIDRFIERVEDYKATVARCSIEEIPSAIAEGLRATKTTSVVVPTGLEGRWREAIEDYGRSHDAPVRADDPPVPQAELNTVHAVVTASTVGAAESGTIMLTHGPDQGRRALTLLPDVHICVVRTDQVVSDIPEATAAIAGAVREGNPVTWISGGSATSDIELSRVEGVHGPRTLYVILAG